MNQTLLLITSISLILIASNTHANTALFSLVTIFNYPKSSENYVQVQSQNQMTRKECETQIFLLSDNKDKNLPFGRSSKWEIIGGEAELKEGKIIVSRWSSNESNFSFLCVPTGWKTKLNNQ